MTSMETAERFAKYVDKSGECWVWTGAHSGGYGYFWMDRLTMRAHRAALILAGATIPDGAMVCHRCDNRECVRPTHLYIGDASSNNRDTLARNGGAARHRPAGTGAKISAGLRHAYATGALQNHEAKRTHCDSGHLYDAANTRIHKGKRDCRACGRIRARRRYWAVRDQANA